MQDSASININLIKEESKRESIPVGYKYSSTVVNDKKEGSVEVFTADSLLYANLIVMKICSMVYVNSMIEEYS